MTLRRWLVLIVGTLFCVSTALFGVVSAAKADPYTTYQYCAQRYVTTSFAYNAGSYNVHASNWYDYDYERDNSPVQPDPCKDINAEIASTGGMVLRVQICPVDDPCFALSWGSLNSFTPYGVTGPSHQLPKYTFFVFRIETTSPETLRIGL